MNRLFGALERIGGTLDRLGFRWCLVGGLAVSARAEPRLTRDVDVIVAVTDDAQAEQLLFHLRQDGFRLRQLLEQDQAGRLATARLLPPGCGRWIRTACGAPSSASSRPPGCTRSATVAGGHARLCFSTPRTTDPAGALSR